MTLTVLHLSHTGLPDSRVERLAMLSNDYAESSFLGPPSTDQKLHQEAFRNIYQTDAFTRGGNLGLPVYYNRLLKRVKEKIKDIQPDLLYAHNIIAGKVAKDLNIPYIYDDHEYWSREMRLRRFGEFSPWKRLMNRVRRFWVPRRFESWEREVLCSAAATVTVSEAIAKEHNQNGANCVVIPNFPLKQEFESIPPPELHQDGLRAISLSSDSIAWVEHRYPGKNMETWEKIGGIIVDWVGRPPPKEWTWIRHRKRIPPAELYEVLRNDYQIGLIPWTRCWFHKYILSNKFVSYSHSGLILVLTDDFDTMLGILPDWARITFGVEQDIKKVLEHLQEKTPEEILTLRKQIQRWAREHIHLDRYADVLSAAIHSVES